MSENAVSRPRICILPNRLMLGGIEKVLLDALQVLHKRYDIEIICFIDEQCRAVLDAIPEDVKLTYRQLPKSRWPGKSYQKVLGKERYDYMIVLRPSVQEAVYACNAAHKILWLHNDYYLGYMPERLPLRKRIAKHLRRRIYRRYDMVWTVSETIAEDMRGCFSLSNIHALPNPLDCKAILEKAQAACDTVFAPEKTNFIMIGRMSPEKGFQRVLRFMCTEVLEKHPQAHLYLMGNGTDDPLLREELKNCAMAHRVSLLGPKANPYPYLRQAQVLICPSTSESFGLVMLEAMLLGVRVITTNTVGGVYVTQNGRYGWCVDNTDAALQAAVEAYLSDADSYRPSLVDAEQWARSHDIHKFAEHLQTLLDQCS